MSERERGIHCDECHCTNRLRHERDALARSLDVSSATVRHLSEQVGRVEAERDAARRLTDAETASANKWSSRARYAEERAAALDARLADVTRERDAAIADAEQARTVPMIARVIADARTAALEEAAEVCRVMAVDCRRAAGPDAYPDTAARYEARARSLDAAESLIRNMALTPAAGGGDRG